MKINFRRAIKTSLAGSALGLILFTNSCGGNGPGNTGGTGGGTNTPTEGESDAALAVLDNAPTSPPTPLSQIILADGSNVQSILNEYGVSAPTGNGATVSVQRNVSKLDQSTPNSPDEYKDLAVAEMLAEAEWLSNRSDWQYPNEGTNAPAQNGLGYVYGSKQYNTRVSAGCCTQQLHALDCSGLMSLTAQNAGISVLDGTINQQNPSAWTIPQSWGVAMTSIPANSTLQSGDIVYWNNAQTAGHIGIVDNGDIVQANGAYVTTCDTNGATSCQRNYSTHRGPNKWSIATTLQAFGNPTAILRLEVPTATYTYTGQDFYYVDNPIDGNQITGTIVLNELMPSNTTVYFINGEVTATSNDGGVVSGINVESTTISNGVSTGPMDWFFLETDSNGKIDAWTITSPFFNDTTMQAVFNPGGSEPACTSYTGETIPGDDVVWVGIPPKNNTLYCGAANEPGTWSGPVLGTPAPNTKQDKSELVDKKAHPPGRALIP